jgi:hypothetical protein
VNSLTKQQAMHRRIRLLLKQSCECWYSESAESQLSDERI